jgi:tryptophanyl-tRNA synthetase
MADDNLTPDQRQFLETACEIADRFNDYQVDEEALINRLGWDGGEFSRIRNELEDAGYITRRGAPQISETGGFWIERAGIDLCPEPLEGRDALQLRE